MGTEGQTSLMMLAAGIRGRNTRSHARSTGAAVRNTMAKLATVSTRLVISAMWMRSSTK